MSGTSTWLWDLLAKKYDRQARDDEALKKTVNRLAKDLRSEDRVLDFACATGVVTFEIAGRVREVLGIDASPKMIRLAREKARDDRIENVRFEETTLFDGSLIEGSYDSIVASNILHLLEDAGQAITRAARLLKSGGILFSSTPCLGNAGFFLRTLLPLVGKIGLISYLRPLEAEALEELHRARGFEVLESDVTAETVPVCFVKARKREA